MGVVTLFSAWLLIRLVKGLLSTSGQNLTADEARRCQKEWASNPALPRTSFRVGFG